MKYNVENQSENIEYENLSKKDAIETAKDESKKHSGQGVFITSSRKKDNTHGYLNPNGDHSQTGEDWSGEYFS